MIKTSFFPLCGILKEPTTSRYVSYRRSTIGSHFLGAIGASWNCLLVVALFYLEINNFDGCRAYNKPSPMGEQPVNIVCPRVYSSKGGAVKQTISFS